MKRSLFIFAAVALCACGPEGGERVVDISNAVPGDLEEVATSWELVAVDEREVPLAEVSDVKRYGDRIFVKSGVDFSLSSHPKIYMVEGGRVAGVLDAYGRGPGEYQSLESFAYCPQTAELIINDRRLKGFRRYRVPELTWVSDEPAGRYFQTFETLDATHSVISLEPDGDEPGGPAIWNHAEGKVDYFEEVESRLLAESFGELRMTREPGGKVLVGVMGRETAIRRASASGFEPAGGVSFKPDPFAPFWDETDEQKAYQAFVSVMESGREFGIGADAPLVSGNKLAFWYLATVEEGPEDGWRPAVWTPQGSRTWSELRVEGYPEPLRIVGSGEGQWCSVLLLELLEDVPAPKGKLYPKLRELAAQGCETVLLFYSPI